MSNINQSDHLLLTEADIENRLTKLINRDGHFLNLEASGALNSCTRRRQMKR